MSFFQNGVCCLIWPPSAMLNEPAIHFPYGSAVSHQKPCDLRPPSWMSPRSLFPTGQRFPIPNHVNSVRHIGWRPFRFLMTSQTTWPFSTNQMACIQTRLILLSGLTLLLVATTWKWQLGSDNMEATTGKRQFRSDNSWPLSASVLFWSLESTHFVQLKNSITSR